MKNDKNTPPKLAKWILSRLYYYEECFALSSSIDEEYFEMKYSGRGLKAKVYYWLKTFEILFQYIRLFLSWSVVMLFNYIKIAFRNIKRQKVYSIINIAGLSVATAACTLILLYIHFELSYERHLNNSSRIFRVVNDFTLGDTHRDFASTPGPAGPAFAEGIPEILYQTRVLRLGPKDRRLAIKKGSENFEESNVFLADPAFFNIFDYEFLLGDKRSSLTETNSIVLTEKSAKKLFRNDDPIGQTLNISAVRIGDMHITGVVENPPKNTHFKFDYIVSYLSIDQETITQMKLDDWGYFSFYTYVLLDKKANPINVAEKMNLIYEKNSGEAHRKIGATWNYSIQKITDIHLRSHISNEIESNNSIEFIYLQFVVAGLIIIIACSNFINLFIARSTARAKEVGLRKVLGAVKRNIKS